MSWSAKWTWKPDTPGSEPAGARISAGKSGSVARSLPISAVSLVKRPGQLHAVAGVSRETDDDPIELLDRLAHVRTVPIVRVMSLVSAFARRAQMLAERGQPRVPVRADTL